MISMKNVTFISACSNNKKIKKKTWVGSAFSSLLNILLGVAQWSILDSNLLITFRLYYYCSPTATVTLLVMLMITAPTFEDNILLKLWLSYDTILANNVSCPSKLIAIPFCKMIIDALGQGAHCFVSFFIIDIEQIIV